MKDDDFYPMNRMSIPIYFTPVPTLKNAIKEPDFVQNIVFYKIKISSKKFLKLIFLVCPTICKKNL